MDDTINTIIQLLAIFFVIPLWCLLAWNGFASAFNLPSLSYWHWVVTALAVRGMFTRPKIGE